MHFLRINKTLLVVITLLAATIWVALPPGTAPERVTEADSTLPDFRAFPAGPERKREFFGFVRPIVTAANAGILEQRSRLQRLREQSEFSKRDRRWLESAADSYGVALVDQTGAERSRHDVVAELLLRVDEVPESLALAQAAKESGWGTSRFAREGNNLFGEWCFTAGCGIVPKQRAAGRQHEVERFPSPAESVASYLRNINTHDSYKSFRQARKAQRDSRGTLSGLELAQELSRYSERREAYVRELRALIVGNQLETTAANENRSDSNELPDRN